MVDRGWFGAVRGGWKGLGKAGKKQVTAVENG